MNTAAMPHALFIIFAEMAVGSLIIIQLLDARALVTRGFLRVSAGAIWAIAGLAWTLALALSSEPDIDGYPIDESSLGFVRWSAFALFAVALPYVAASFSQSRRATLAAGVAAAVVGVVLLMAVAVLIAPPMWGYAAAALSLMVGALVVGAVSTAMVLGHWYLVTPKLPSRPLDLVTLGLFGGLIAQGALIIVSVTAPVREEVEAGTDLAMAENLAFWLRILALLLPTALAWMAWRSSRERAMQAATGLLYLTMGAVLTGELLARGLLFATARAV